MDPFSGGRPLNHSRSGTADLITDFVSAVEDIDLTALDASTKILGNMCLVHRRWVQTMSLSESRACVGAENSPCLLQTYPVP